MSEETSCARCGREFPILHDYKGFYLCWYCTDKAKIELKDFLPSTCKTPLQRGICIKDDPACNSLLDEIRSYKYKVSKKLCKINIFDHEADKWRYFNTYDQAIQVSETTFAKLIAWAKKVRK